MVPIGYHASHEQFTPRSLMDWTLLAEREGFSAAMCSDHFHPWSEAQGQSGHAWTWLGAALAGTRFPMGVVNAPVGRYHPGEIAQAVATLECLYPGRFWLSVGSGEALNESAFGVEWPDKPARNARLREAVDLMRALWRGDCVSHDGRFTLRGAKLYTRPQTPPRVLLAALTAETARWGRDWADGLITVANPGAPVREVIDAFRSGQGTGKPVYLQVKLSHAGSHEQALQGALEQWRTNALLPEQVANGRTPANFERMARGVDEAAIAKAVHVSADTDQHIAWLREYIALGVDALYLHNVNRGQERFIIDFARRVLPALR